MSDLFDLVSLLHEQSEAKTRAAGWDKVHTLMVAPDVWAELLAQVPRYEGSAPSFIGVKILVNRYLRPGEMIPLDCNGNPLLQQKPLPKPASEEVSPSRQDDLR